MKIATSPKEEGELAANVFGIVKWRSISKSAGIDQKRREVFMSDWTKEIVAAIIKRG